MCRELSQQEEESTQEEAAIVIVLGDHIDIRDPLIGEGILQRWETP